MTGYWQMRTILEDYFSKMLKIDHAIVKRAMQADHSSDRRGSVAGRNSETKKKPSPNSSVCYTLWAI